MRRMVAVVGPSGAGKDLLMTMAAAADPALYLARRVITRPSAAGGEDFDGVSEAEFAARESAGEFALSWRAHGLGYAIPHAALAGQGVLLFNASRQVVAQAQALWPGLLVLHVTAPPDVLARRLQARGRETGADQQARLQRAAPDWPPGVTLREVVNDADPGTGLQRFLAALQSDRG